jgi:hypothetical protein
MGLFSTRWEAQYEGHNLTVSRNELTRGVVLEWDGREIARKRSFVGLAELRTAPDGGPTVHVRVRPGSRCEISVDGTPVTVSRVQ